MTITTNSINEMNEHGSIETATKLTKIMWMTTNRIVIYMMLVPLVFISFDNVGLINALLLILATYAFEYVVQRLELFMAFRFYGTELKDYEVELEANKETIMPNIYYYKYISSNFPKLQEVRLNKTMSKKQKREAVDKVSSKICFNTLFKISIVVFIISLLLWIYYPAITGNGTINPCLSRFITYINSI